MTMSPLILASHAGSRAMRCSLFAEDGDLGTLLEALTELAASYAQYRAADVLRRVASRCA
jgi:hypothetical protein